MAANPAGSIQATTHRLPCELPAEVVVLMTGAEAQRIGMGLDWYRLLVGTALESGDTAWLHVLMRDSVAVAALPVLRSVSAPRTVHALANFYTSLYAPIVSADAPADALEHLVRAACLLDGPVDALQFAPMDACSASYASLRSALQACGLVSFEYFCHGNWYLPVKGNWASYLAERKGGLRSTIKRMEKRLEAAGVRTVILSDERDVATAAQAFDHVYAKSWKTAEPYPDFMPGLIALSARRGWLRMGVMYLDDVAIAAQLWLVSHGRAEIYKVAYDEAHKAMTPGTVLTARMMKHVLEVDGVTEVDYLIGDDSYKSQWMTDRRERWGLMAYNPRTVRGLWGCCKEIAGRRARAVQRRVKAWQSGTPA